MWRKNLEVADRLVEVFQFVTGGQFYVFLSYLDRFVYGFCLIGIRILVVSGCSSASRV